MNSDARLEEAVRAIVADVRRQLADSITVARGVERLMAIFADDESRPAERFRRENVAALAEMADLGNGRDAAMIVAARRTDDPHRRLMLAKRWRRMRRKLKEPGSFRGRILA